jgi:anti-sigma factor RsiW
VLGDEQRESVELHLADCDRCAAHARSAEVLDLHLALRSWRGGSSSILARRRPIQKTRPSPLRRPNETNECRGHSEKGTP